MRLTQDMNFSYRKFCAVLAWGVLILQYLILLRSGEHGGFGATSLVYLGYFTILTNILVALAFSVGFYKEGSAVKAFFNHPSVRAAIALYIGVVAVVYYAALASAHNPEGPSAVLNVFLHAILPLLYIIDWLVHAGNGKMSFKHLPLWVLYPLAYAIFNIVRGAWTGFYPYPFLNISELGYGGVGLNMLGFTFVYALGGAAVIGLARFLHRRIRLRAA